VETENARFAVDCGLFQGSKAIKEYNYKDFKVAPASIDFLIVTHAHIDHSGLIPKLVRHGFKGNIYCTHATAELLKVMLPDSAHIQETEVERKNRKAKRAGLPLIEPIYTVEDALKSLELIRTLNYDEVNQLAPGVEVRLRDAGHILGSAILEVWLQENNQRVKVVFSGDLGQSQQPIIKDPSVVESADYVILESTYGDRYHRGGYNRREQLKEVINETMAKGGNLIIPAFAVERTQDLLYDLYFLFKNGELDPTIDIYIDSPLAIAATEIFQKSIEYYDAETRAILQQGDHPLILDNLKYSRTQEESMLLNELKGHAIIISASGMCDAGRIKHHLKHNLWRRESTVLFVGYQAEGSLGRRILEGEKRVRIHGEEVAVNADIRSIEAFSAHADQGGLLDWLKNFRSKLRQVILVHGEEPAQNALADLIRKELNVPVFIPEWLDEIDLLAQAEAAADQVAPAASLAVSDQALQAEKLYLEIRMKLNELLTSGAKTENYAQLIQKLEMVKELL